jgi:CubicO group peptidase (beta-lactamase class C family)
MTSQPKDRSLLFRILGASLAAASVAGLIAAGSLPTVRPEEAKFSSERLSAIHETIQRHVDAGDITGAVTMVASRGRIVHFEANGLMDLASKRPMVKDSLFRIMSMTKPVTAVAVMMMEEKGKLRVTDPVSKYIPEFKQMKVSTAPREANSGLCEPATSR